MGSIVGFTIFSEVPSEASKRLIVAEDRALSHFPHLERRTLTTGSATLHLWGHAPLSDRIHTMPDDSLLVLIGSPHGPIEWHKVEEQILKLETPDDFVLPWDGRVILLHISADGKRWLIWNDWLGSIRTFHTTIREGRLLTTLEPVTAAAADASPRDFFLPGLVSMLLNGYFINDWTLYKNIKTIPPDSLAQWDEHGFRTKTLWTIQPSQERWETSWDDQVDEFYAISHKAIANALQSHSTWTLPLSSGLDSRLIAGVLADVGAHAHAYAWGGAEDKDAIYSQKIAKTLGFPWRHVPLPDDFLVKFTPAWADWFGASTHFHGMYIMCFLDEIKRELSAPAINGYIGDVLTGDGLKDFATFHSTPQYRIATEWYGHWKPEQLRSVAKFPLEEALEANAACIKQQIETLPGARHQKLTLLQLWNRQRQFTSFMSTLMDYERGVATPFMDRAFVKFCLSLPYAAFDHRRILADVFIRYYGRLAVIPGSYAQDPYILTGTYLVKRRLARTLSPSLRNRLLKGFDDHHIDANFVSLLAHGKQALAPLFEKRDQVAEWFDISEVEKDFDEVMQSTDVRALRRLQAVQTLASRL